jgi:hypothetical protein
VDCRPVVGARAPQVRATDQKIATLAQIAAATGGVSTSWENPGALPEPKVTLVAALRQTRPLLPPWAWTLLAAGMMGTHWLLRRTSGLL